MQRGDKKYDMEKKEEEICDVVKKVFETTTKIKGTYRRSNTIRRKLQKKIH